jgi:UDP-N-acetylmuramyl pentapeptide phosphotransferase/UDP-N-acetylglucosamine-1-phosphate transferase
MTISEFLPSLLAVVLAAMASACIIWAIRPLLVRYALAKPNLRSSHLIATPQGEGIAVILATVVVAAIIIAGSDKTEMKIPAGIFGAALFLAIVGLFDDIKSIAILPRLTLQAIAVSIVVFSGGGDLRIVSACPLWIEYGLILLCGLWFVNLVNFMDGLDWMTVVEVVPVTGAIVIIGSLDELPASTTIVAAALCGAVVGFAPFNRPVAKIFLGDVGSLPIGLLLGWCLLQLVRQQQLAAALLLPMYYLLDATVTLARRAVKREPFWAAHRTHFYQRATDNGFSVLRVVSEVFALNLLLAALAIASAITRSNTTKIFDLSVGGLAAVMLIYRFTRPHLRIK